MPADISLLISHPKELILSGIQGMLEKTSIRIVGVATNAAETIRLAKKLKPAVVLMTAMLPDGDSFDVVRKLRQELPRTQHVLLAALDNPTYMARARAAGASNCLLKSVPQGQLVAALEHAASGKPAPVESGPFAGIVSQMHSGPKVSHGETGLTPREEQVLCHVAYGLSNDEIARTLDISIETVKEHVQNMLRKLEVRDRTQAAVWAVHRGLA